MVDFTSNARRRSLMLAVSLAALACGAPAFGQGDQVSAAPADSKRPRLSDARPTSPNATINLVNLLVKQGVITEEQAATLIKQADDEAYVARQAAKNASAKADEAAKAANAAASAAEPPGTRHVTYVPEIVKRQLREEIKKEVMAKAEKENWASPGLYPEWAQRIHFYGDFRARYQGSFFPAGNAQADAINFNAINSGSPYDLSADTNPYNWPTYNTTQNRNQVRLRARLGMDADLTNGFSAGLRIATGQDNSPVSTNQTLGANGSNFSKYQLWLDRGYLKYETWGQDLVASVGRFDNPFWSPTDLVWYRELGFDGVALQGKYRFSEEFTPFGVIGAFPTFNTDFNAGTNINSEASKFQSHDKWLFGAQVGFASRFDPVHEFRVAAALYDFENVQGQLSDDACFPVNTSVSCNTDLSRPLFAQKGNTYMTLRNIGSLGTNNNFGNDFLFQYFGLVQKFRPLVASGSLDMGDFHPYHIVVDGEFVWNTAFNRALTANGVGLTQLPGNVAGYIYNNRAPTSDGTFGPFNGGDKGWMTRVTVGNREIKHFGDWNAHVGYKYLESDATLDAFTDPDFGLGGTNLKGYFIGGNVGLSENVWASIRWMSANNIGGLPYAVDVLQVDLNAKF
ncbi:conserved exported hypothetical protein [Bradyrhizobium sp. STM 3843]|uniref:putative porin n=1 Tax=Bradyrhizobium sp. STM 3843 TaxID=551947 RepID=UPI000240AE24|nr:putative porin [Bradyrhizobium sp. STM 3843]CCE05258.1 conserved exported hypothetical protein [Bradyrhizobium sp. STM 3843]